MLFKRTVFLSLFIVSVSACSPESIPNEKQALPDNIGREDVVETVSQQGAMAETSRYTQEHFEIQKLIAEMQLTEAGKKLEEKIFGTGSLNKVTYTSPSYGGFLELYIQWAKKVKSEGTVDQKNSLEGSLKDFEERFLSACVGEDGICEMLSQALKSEPNTIWAVLEIALSKQSSPEKLKFLGVAYDLSNRRGSSVLEDAYFTEAILTLSEVEEARSSMPQALQRQHLINVIAISNQRKWSESDSEKMALYSMIQPWKYRSDSNRALNDLRRVMTPYLPVYSRDSVEVSEGMRTIVGERLKSVESGKKDLSAYPAYSDIDLENIKNRSVEAAFLSLEMYFKNISVTEANAFVANVSDKSKFVDEVYEVSKLLVRWDIAQLGIESSEKLNAKLSEQEAITNAHFQQVLDWSKTLVPSWTEFHTVRLWSIKTFIESNIRHSRKYDEIETQEFFSSVNRNILKTVTYPNMLAFASKMIETEWDATVRILWFKFSLDTALLMDYMMTGHYQGPWFNFTNLTEEKSWYPEERTSLFRSDMLDALYYFFATRTHEIYGVSADKFISGMSESIIKRRRPTFERTIETQKQLYFHEGSSANKMINWCAGMTSGNFEPERIPYYSLASYITPNVYEMKGDALVGNETFYYGDYYPDEAFERLHTTNDRFRLELEPIEQTLNQYLGIANRLSQSFPDLNIGNMSETKSRLQEFKHLKMTYLGVQKAIMKKFGDCLFKAEKEAKRRVREVAQANFQYFKNVIHPLMKLVKEGSLSVENANAVIQDFHGNQPGIFDHIDVSNSNDPIFIITQLSHILRVRMLLTEGVHFESPHTVSVTIPPIVGPHMDIPVPSNFLEDVRNNPYITANTSSRLMYTMNYSQDADVFAIATSTRTTDETRSDLFSTRFTEWDQFELGTYAFEFRYVVEQKVIFYQLRDHKYYDVDKPNCWVTRVEDLADDCVVEESPAFESLAETMKNILLAYRISEDDLSYLQITGLQGWVGSNALHTVVEMDPTMQMNYMNDTLPYSKIAGLMDLPYQLLEADVLGLSFQTIWDIELAKGNDRPIDVSCASRREGCYWSWEREIANEFFWARAKRPGFIFNYDYQIVDDDFQQTREAIIGKFQRLIELEEKAPQYVEDLKQNDENLSLIRINAFQRPSELRDLNPNFKNNKRLFEKFFDESTEGFYLKDHNWVEELQIK